jgi:anti-repressor protein
MATEITPFAFPTTGQQVRAVTIDGKPWFVAVDAATILGYANTRKAITDHVPARHRKGNDSFPLADLGLHPQTVLISEAGLYRLIMRSNTPLALPFQEWVTADVLPAIRETGSYSAAPPVPELSRRDLARMVIEEADRADAAEGRIAELEAPAEAWNTLALASGDYSVRDAAQILDRDSYISTGQNRLFTKLRELGWIDSRGVPYQAQVDLGRLVQRPTSYTHPYKGEPVLSSQVRITVKGVEALRKHLGGGGDGHLFAVPGGA